MQHFLNQVEMASDEKSKIMTLHSTFTLLHLTDVTFRLFPQNVDFLNLIIITQYVIIAIFYLVKTSYHIII